MAIYTVELDGNQFDIEGPDGASQADLENAARQHQAGGQTPVETNPPAESAPPTESKARRFIRKGANALPTIMGIGVPAVAAIGTSGMSLPATAGLAGASAAAGEGIKQAILSSLGDQAPTLEEAALPVVKEGVKTAALTYGGGKVFQGLGKGARLAKDLITKPGAAEVAQLGKEKLLEVGERGAEKLALARATREAAKKGLITAEESAGLHFKSTPGFEELIRDPKKMADFTEKIGRLASKTPEELAQSIPSEQLQLFRKIAQEGEKMANLSDIAKSQLRQGKDVFTQALGKAEPKIGESLSGFRDADRVVGEIPGEIKNKLISTKMQNARDVLDAKSLDKKRKVIKGLAGAAAGYLGLKSIFK